MSRPNAQRPTPALGYAPGPNAQRRGTALLWSLAALGLAIALAPVYVGLCGSLASLSARGAHRLAATQRGEAELERLRTRGAEARTFLVPELPGGRASVTSQAAPGGLRQVTVTLIWEERAHPAQAEWTTLVSEPRRGGTETPSPSPRGQARRSARR